MAVGAQAGAVQPSLGEGVDDLLLAAAEHVGDYRGRRDPYQQYMAQADAVEAVFQRDDALNLVCLDHRREHITHDKWRLAGRDIALGDVVGHGQNAAEVVGRVTPLGGEPGVIVIEPADDAADVPRGLHRVEPELRSWYAGAMWHDGAFHQRAEQLGA